MTCPFEMRWPVLDPEEPASAFIDRAGPELRVELRALGLIPMGRPRYTWEMHPGIDGRPAPFLVARVEVRDHAIGRPRRAA